MTRLAFVLSFHAAVLVVPAQQPAPFTAAAINQQITAGAVGSTVTLAAGTYTIDKPLTRLKQNQALVGGPGVVFNVTHRGTPEQVIVDLDFGSSVSGIKFKAGVNPTIVPSIDDINKYPWCVRVRYGAENWTAKELDLYDSPKGIVSYGSDGLIANVSGGCWWRGLIADTCGHTITIQNVSFHDPGWIADYTAANALPPISIETSPFIAAQKQRSIAFTFQRVDGLRLENMFAARHRYGLLFTGSAPPYDTDFWWGSRPGGHVKGGGIECTTPIKFDWSMQTGVWNDWTGKLGVTISGVYLSPTSPGPAIEIIGGPTPDDEPIVHLTDLTVGPLPNPDSLIPYIDMKAGRLCLTSPRLYNDRDNRGLFLKADRGEVSWVGGSVQGRKTHPAVILGKDVRSATFSGVSGLKDRIQSQAQQLETSALTYPMGAEPPPVDPPVAGIYQVGPGKAYSEPHQVPRLKAGETMEIHYRATPYLSKVQIAADNVSIVGILGPNGEKPNLHGANAIEPAHASYWSQQISHQGIITVAPAVGGTTIKNAVIRNLKLTGARNAGAGFTDYAGRGVGWNSLAAGVAIYRADTVLVSACDLENNDQGVYGTTNDGYGSVKAVTVEWCNIKNCGVSSNSHNHGTYIEGIGTIYQFNRYMNPISGAAGSALKDRGAGTIIRFNLFDHCCQVALDLVDPEEGSGLITTDPKWGKTYVYGNRFLNSTASWLIHFGFDGMEIHKQKDLYLSFNTVVMTGSRWYTMLVKSNGEPSRVFHANNIYHSTVTQPSSTVLAEFSLATEEWVGGTKHIMRGNFLPTHASQWHYVAATDPKKPDPDGWATQIRAANPGFVGGADFSLAATSPCRGKAVDVNSLAWPGVMAPGFGFKTGSGWVPRLGWANCGFAE